MGYALGCKLLNLLPQPPLQASTAQQQNQIQAQPLLAIEAPPQNQMVVQHKENILPHDAIIPFELENPISNNDHMDFDLAILISDCEKDDMLALSQVEKITKNEHCVSKQKAIRKYH